METQLLPAFGGPEWKAKNAREVAGRPTTGGLAAARQAEETKLRVKAKAPTQLVTVYAPLAFQLSHEDGLPKLAGARLAKLITELEARVAHLEQQVAPHLQNVERR